jgi:ATP-dependent Clp protease ATP-binding subunit ClpC
MNDSVLTELKTVVERAVRPIRASIARKRRMREELLDHLMTTYEEELERSTDEQAALEQARRRFGEPGDLTKELRTSLSWRGFVGYWFDAHRNRPGESVLRLALRHLLLSALAMTAALLVMLPIIWLGGRIREIGLFLHIMLVTCLFSAGFSFSMAILTEQMGRVLYGGGSERPVRGMIPYFLASLPVFPALTAFVYWGLLGDLASGLTGFLLGSAAAPLAPLLFFMMARRMRDDILYEREWAGTEIEAS